jgi:hypothetical protein
MPFNEFHQHQTSVVIIVFLQKLDDSKWIQAKIIILNTKESSNLNLTVTPPLLPKVPPKPVFMISVSISVILDICCVLTYTHIYNPTKSASPIFVKESNLAKFYENKLSQS